MNRFLMLLLAAGAGAATALALNKRQRGADHRKLKADIGKWEGEGGNVPEVEPVSPVVTPEKSVPVRH